MDAVRYRALGTLFQAVESSEKERSAVPVQPSSQADIISGQMCTARKGACIESCEEKDYESCGRTCCKRCMADRRCSPARAGTRSSAGEDARKRYLLYRRTRNTRTHSRTVSADPRSRAGRRGGCGVGRRHYAKGRRPRGHRMDSIHVWTL